MVAGIEDLFVKVIDEPRLVLYGFLFIMASSWMLNYLLQQSASRSETRLPVIDSRSSIVPVRKTALKTPAREPGGELDR